MNAAAETRTDGYPLSRTLVYGLGGTGLSAARHFARTGQAAAYFDTRENPPGLDELRRIDAAAEILDGEITPERAAAFDRILVSPGIPDSDPVLSRLRAANAKLVSDIELFVAEAEAEFVAVTGSNGKSTATTLIAAMCDAAGRDSLAGGNLGRAALDLLALPDPQIYVLELSSFQLQRTPDLPASVSLLLNISPDHLDWHRDMAEYREAKYRVFAEANAAVYNRDDAEAKRRLRSGVPSVSFGLDRPDAGQFGIRIIDDERWLAFGDESLIKASEMGLVGHHNQANALASLAVCHLLGLDLSRCVNVLIEFAGLPHRMQFVRDIGGVRYINDSKATNVGAAIASVQSIDDGVVLLAGGQGKGGDFASLAEAVADRLKALIVFGEDADSIARAFAGRAKTSSVGTLAQAVETARGVATSGDTVLLAPACASFDQFDNFNARGDAFVSLVEGLPS